MNTYQSKDAIVTEKINYLFETYGSDGAVLKERIKEFITEELINHEKNLLEIKNKELDIQEEELKKKLFTMMKRARHKSGADLTQIYLALREMIHHNFDKFIEEFDYKISSISRIF